MPVHGNGPRGQAVLAAFDANVRDALARLSRRPDGGKVPRVGDSYDQAFAETMVTKVGKSTSVGMAEELALVLEDDLRHVLRKLERHCKVDAGRLEASGRTKPRIALHARSTSANNLSIAVLDGVPGPYGLPAPESDWETFPLGGTGADGRPVDEVAFVRGAMVLGYGRAPAGTGQASDARLHVLADLTGLVMAAWRHCKEVLSVHYEVLEGHAPTLEGDAPADGLDTRPLRIAPPAAHVALEAREREVAALKEAEAFLREYAGDARALSLRWRNSRRGKLESRALASELDAGGIRVGPSSAWMRLARIDTALRVVDPGWDDAFARSETKPVAGEVRRDAGSATVPTTEGIPEEGAAVGRRGPNRGRPFARVPASPGANYEVPDEGFYARLRRYPATTEELAALSARSVDDVVRRVNDGLRARGRSRISQGDFPSTKDRFNKLLRIHAALLEDPSPVATPSP